MRRRRLPLIPIDAPESLRFLWLWSRYVCPFCKSVMLSNKEWEEHQKSHIRLEQAGKEVCSCSEDCPCLFKNTTNDEPPASNT